MHTWQVQQAKARFSEVVEKARLGEPQVITRHGKEEVVIVSVKDYPLPVLRERSKPSFIEHLLSAPKVEGFAELLENNRLADREADRKRDEELDHMFEDVHSA